MGDGSFDLQSIAGTILPFAVLFAIFYFLVVYPQQQQQKKHKAMIETLQKGDHIVTAGGLYAEVVKPEAEFIKVRISDETVVKLGKEFIAKKLDAVEKLS